MKTRFPALLAIVLFIGVAARAEELPEAAKKAQKVYRAKVDAAVKPLREGYLGELQKLQAEATRAGRLDEALTLKREIERNQAETFFGRWDGMKEPVVINADGTIQHGRDAGKWEIQGEELVLKWDNGWVHRHALGQSGESIRGRQVSPEGKSVTFTLTRIR